MVSTAPDIGSVHGILRLGNAFCQAQALLTAVELDLFTVLHDGPATEEEISGRLGLHGRGLRDFLRLLVVLGLLEEENGRYRAAAGPDRYLVSGLPGYVGGALLGAKANLYPVWDGLTETLRSGRPRSAADGFAAMLDDPEQLRRYVRMMEGTLRPLIPRLAEAVDWSGYRSVLDVGGCRGGLAGQLVITHSGLAGHVFDLPQMEPLFREHMAELGTAGAVRFHAGDFFRDPLPRADVLILGHILHNWPYGQREELVRKAFQAVNPGGVLLVHDRMLDDERPSVDNLLASLIMALVTEEGSEYTIGELTELAGSAGFASVSHQRLDDNETLVLCRKAAGRTPSHG
ncbi:methyltransferase [Streptosporangium roseum]|uniref:methyltransferase n=1 Tax=Streptosporangium roseum TaxID=2001 RepID=UPI003334932E